MTDIVERLRKPTYWLRSNSEGTASQDKAPYQAADEIEKLDRQLVLAWKTIGEQEAEIERLRTQIAEFKQEREMKFST